MIDFHSHILPGMDDGAKDIAQSIKMLELLKSQGVDCVVASSHYYSGSESPQSFIHRRSKAFAALKEALPHGLPDIVLGAEVLYFDGMANCEELELLCIENTHTLLLEMPFRKWNERIIDEVIALSADYDIVLAHIERYFGYAGGDTFLKLARSGISFQINDTFFDGLFAKRKALKLLGYGAKVVLGSDCHNLTARAPKMADAQRIIAKKLGSGTLNDITDASYAFLKKGATV